jgi:hypothetical protein
MLVNNVWYVLVLYCPTSDRVANHLHSKLDSLARNERPISRTVFKSSMNLLFFVHLF